MLQHRRLGITMGDPAGIGPEIIVKLFDSAPPSDCLIYGDVQHLKRTAQALGSKLSIEQASCCTAPLKSGVLTVLQACEPLPSDLTIGQVSATAGKAAYLCVQQAIDDALSNHLAGIVTAPLNKQAIHLAGFDFPGHTEILAQRAGNIPVAMMLANESIRVVLVTIHVPLRDVANIISIDLEVQAIGLANQICQQLGISEPRIAVAGLNPHASEAGKFGNEEQQIIEPAIALARSRGMNVSGPWPGDTVFGRARQGEFDVVVAQYHDQGLIPVKYMGLDQGVNVTVGLPFIRTSVDHGTAFDIAGRGLASEASLGQAIKMAKSMLNEQARQ